jgi:plasmid stabilization system protein ParE
MSEKRPKVRIRFKYNVDTGEIEEFIIDDNAPAASEAYHDKVAHAIAARLARDPDVADAGPVRLPQVTPQTVEPPAREEEEKEEEEEVASE